MPTHILVYVVGIIVLTYYYPVVTGLSVYSLDNAVKYTYSCQLATAIHALSDISVKYGNICILTYTSGKLHGSEGVCDIIVITFATGVLNSRLGLLYGKDGIGPVGATFTTAIDITVDDKIV